MPGRLLLLALAVLVVAPFEATAARPHDQLLIVTGTPARVAVVDTATGRVRTVADGSQAAWSPEGNRIAFVSVGTATGRSELFVINADGRRLRRLTRDPLAEHDPAWSPDGTRIAYLQQQPLDPALTGLPPRDDLMVLNVRTGAVRQVTRDDTNKGSLGWSPDGRDLVFEIHRHGLGGHAAVVDADTGEAVDTWLRGAYPVWSPNMDVAYLTTDRDQAVLNVARADGEDGRVLLRGEREIGVSGLSWSPDGRSIAFSYGGWSMPWSRIDSIDARTGERRRLTPTGRKIDLAPSWSPDGTQIAFARWHPGPKKHNPSLAIVSRRGGSTRVLPDAKVEFDSGRASWQPRQRPGG